MSEIHLAPGLLLSMPQLEDPNFRRAVVLMIEHDEEGSFGLIVNQPADLEVQGLLEALDLEWQGPAGEVVFSGGPVMPASGWVLHEPVPGVRPAAPSLHEALEGSGSMALTPDLMLSTSPENLEVLAKHPPERLRFLLGYAGWGPDQLASEMAKGSWLHAELDLEILFQCPAEDMWKRAVATLGIDPETIVQTKGIH